MWKSRFFKKTSVKSTISIIDVVNWFHEISLYLLFQAISAVIDFTWSGWDSARQISLEIGLPYLRVEVSNAPFVEAADNFLSQRDAIDAALVFETEKELDQSLYFIVGNYELRILVLSLDDTSRDPFER